VSENTAISGRYAKALFALAHEKGQAVQVSADMQALEAMLKASSDLKNLVHSPLIARRDQTAAVTQLAEKSHFSAVTCNLLGLLAKNRRLSLLAPIIAAYRAMVAAANNEKTAEVTSAYPLHLHQVEALKAKLSAQLGGKVNLTLTTNPEILGGLIIKVGSRLMDNSVKGKLDRLELLMKGSH
jgi:F-type H+-transporting ATPase subunit delta